MNTLTSWICLLLHVRQLSTTKWCRKTKTRNSQGHRQRYHSIECIRLPTRL